MAGRCALGHQDLPQDELGRGGTMSNAVPKGFNCMTCGKYHKFGAYVAAHSTISLTHTCKCGAKHTVLDYKVREVKKGKRP